MFFDIGDIAKPFLPLVFQIAEAVESSAR